MTYATAQQRSDKAQTLGLEHGKACGSWVIDGNTSEDTARRILQGHEDGDPEILDMEPSPLSGEWADDPTPQSLYAELGMSDDDVERDDPAGQLLTDYELAFSEAYWAEVQRSAVGFFGDGILPDIEQTDEQAAEARAYPDIDDAHDNGHHSRCSHGPNLG